MKTRPWLVALASLALPAMSVAAANDAATGRFELAGSRLVPAERTAGERYDVAARLLPAPAESQDRKFELAASLKSTSATCAAEGVLFANGFE